MVMLRHPGIVEAILDGRQPQGLRLAEMLGAMGRPFGTVSGRGWLSGIDAS
jgi:hypothetical protein